MSNGLPGQAAPTWQQPLEMLDACHGRIRHQLQTIWRLADHVPKHGADAAARTAASGVLRYFAIDAINHHEDEERDLFPSLMAAIPRQERRPTKALIDRLLADHRQIGAYREPILARLLSISTGKAVDLDVEAVEVFAALCIEHIHLETAELLPLARRVLTPEILRSLAVTMSVRRGVKLEELPFTQWPR